MRHALLTFQVQFIYHTCSPASLTAGEGLAIQPKIGASRAAVEAVYEGDQWLLTYLTVFSLPYPNWLLCSSFLFASSQSLYFVLSVAQTSCMTLNFLIFFPLLTCSIISFSFSSFFLFFVTLILLIFSLSSRINGRNIMFCRCLDHFFSTLLYHFCPTSFVEFW